MGPGRPFPGPIRGLPVDVEAEGEPPGVEKLGLLLQRVESGGLDIPVQAIQVQAAVDLCLRDPGYDVNLRVTADLEAFVKVWMGDARLADTIHDGQVMLDGPRHLVRAFPGWLRLNVLASVKRPASSGSPAAPPA